MNRFLTQTALAARRCNATMMMRIRPVASSMTATSSSSSSRSLWILHRPSTIVAAAAGNEVPQRLFDDLKSMDHRPRFFGNKKKNKGGGGGGGKPALSVVTCYSQYGMEDEIDKDMLTNFNQIPSMNEMKKRMADEYGVESASDIDSLEYYDAKNSEWTELTNPQQQLKGMNAPVKVRVPEFFDHGDEDEDEHDDNDDYNPDEYGVGDYDDDAGDEFLVQATIKGFVEELKEEGYSPAQQQGQMKSNQDGNTIELREWILKRAETDETVKRLLLSQVGALDHVVQCLHFGFLWKPESKSDDDAPVEASFTPKSSD